MLWYNNYGDYMKSIKKELVIEQEINKSKFINYLIPVQSVDEVKIKLSELKELYSDANHHCYAYVIGENQEIQKYSDDGEPSKTAGMPMIEVLKKNDLTNVLNVSIRYFGGIKLGAGGLVRAYTKGCANSILQATFTELKKFNKVKLSITFDLIGQVEKYIRDYYILDETIYDTKVHYYITIADEEYDSFVFSITEKTSGMGDIEIIKTYKQYV